MSSAMVGRERSFCAPAVYWLSDDESTISDCWRGRAIYRRKSLPTHPQEGPRVVRSLYESLWSLLPVGKSPFVSQGHREKRTVCIFQKLLQPMSKRRNEKESWKVFREDQNALALLTQRNKQKFLFPWSLPKCSPHREEEAAALRAPKGGQTPALRKSWPRGPLLDGSWDVFCFGKLCQVPGLGSSDLLKSHVTLCQGMCRSLGIPRRLMSSLHPDTLKSLGLVELRSYGEELVRFLFVLQASKPGEVRTTTEQREGSWDLKLMTSFPLALIQPSAQATQCSQAELMTVFIADSLFFEE